MSNIRHIMPFGIRKAGNRATPAQSIEISEGTGMNFGSGFVHTAAGTSAIVIDESMHAYLILVSGLDNNALVDTFFDMYQGRRQPSTAPDLKQAFHADMGYIWGTAQALRMTLPLWCLSLGEPLGTLPMITPIQSAHTPAAMPVFSRPPNSHPPTIAPASVNAPRNEHAKTAREKQRARSPSVCEQALADPSFSFRDALTTPRSPTPPSRALKSPIESSTTSRQHPSYDTVKPRHQTPATAASSTKSSNTRTSGSPWTPKHSNAGDARSAPTNVTHVSDIESDDLDRQSCRSHRGRSASSASTSSRSDVTSDPAPSRSSLSQMRNEQHPDSREKGRQRARSPSDQALSPAARVPSARSSHDARSDNDAREDKKKRSRNRRGRGSSLSTQKGVGKAPPPHVAATDLTPFADNRRPSARAPDKTSTSPLLDVSDFQEVRAPVSSLPLNHAQPTSDTEGTQRPSTRPRASAPHAYWKKVQSYSDDTSSDTSDSDDENTSRTSSSISERPTKHSRTASKSGTCVICHRTKANTKCVDCDAFMHSVCVTKQTNQKRLNRSTDGAHYCPAHGIFFNGAHCAAAIPLVGSERCTGCTFLVNKHDRVCARCSKVRVQVLAPLALKAKVPKPAGSKATPHIPTPTPGKQRTDASDEVDSTTLAGAALKKQARAAFSWDSVQSEIRNAVMNSFDNVSCSSSDPFPPGHVKMCVIGKNNNMIGDYFYVSPDKLVDEIYVLCQETIDAYFKERKFMIVIHKSNGSKARQNSDDKLCDIGSSVELVRICFSGIGRGGARDEVQNTQTEGRVVTRGAAARAKVTTRVQDVQRARQERNTRANVSLQKRGRTTATVVTAGATEVTAVPPKTQTLLVQQQAAAATALLTTAAATDALAPGTTVVAAVATAGAAADATAVVAAPTQRTAKQMKNSKRNAKRRDKNQQVATTRDAATTTLQVALDPASPPPPPPPSPPGLATVVAADPQVPLTPGTSAMATSPGSVAPARHPSSRDYNCSRCNFFNFARNVICYSCQEPHEPTATSQAAPLTLTLATSGARNHQPPLSRQDIERLIATRVASDVRSALAERDSMDTPTATYSLEVLMTCKDPHEMRLSRQAGDDDANLNGMHCVVNIDGIYFLLYRIGEGVTQQLALATFYLRMHVPDTRSRYATDGFRLNESLLTEFLNEILSSSVRTSQLLHAQSNPLAHMGIRKAKLFTAVPNASGQMTYPYAWDALHGRFQRENLLFLTWTLGKDTDISSWAFVKHAVCDYFDCMAALFGDTPREPWAAVPNNLLNKLQQGKYIEYPVQVVVQAIERALYGAITLLKHPIRDADNRPLGATPVRTAQAIFGQELDNIRITQDLVNGYLTQSYKANGRGMQGTFASSSSPATFAPIPRPLCVAHLLAVLDLPPLAGASCLGAQCTSIRQHFSLVDCKSKHQEVYASIMACPFTALDSRKNEITLELTRLASET